MTRTTRQILEQSLTLPAEARAQIAQKLILSLDEQSETDAAKLWLLELEKRSRDMDEGAIDLSDWAAVKRSISRKLIK